MPLRVALLGGSDESEAPNVGDSVVLRLLEIASGTRVELVQTKAADLVLIQPYRYPFKSTAAGTTFESMAKRIPVYKDKDGAERILRKLYKIPSGARILAISHENLDRRPWQAFGNLLLQTEIPRLTFWPQDIDPKGFRFPYWWNYVDWPEIPRLGAAERTRFGSLYDIETLCATQDMSDDSHPRYEKAVWLTRHLDFPRGSILAMIKKYMDVDVIQGVPWGQKMELLRSYRYCVTTENSTGYGYETEKNLEARVAGCIPVGYIQNPFSDFNENAFFFHPPTERVTELPPLLNQVPTLDGLLKYLGESVLKN
jgi:hypothetical protein